MNHVPFNGTASKSSKTFSETAENIYIEPDNSAFYHYTSMHVSKPGKEVAPPGLGSLR
jgi:hypothetical protein